MEQIKAAWLRLPSTVRSFVVDFIETAFGVLIALNIAFPQSRDDLVATGGVVLAAIASAFVSAARRHLPGWIAWLRASFPASLL